MAIHAGSITSQITPRYIAGGNRLMKWLPKVQQFGWTPDGEGTMCAQSQLCLWLPSLSMENCWDPLPGEGTKPKQSSLQGSVLFTVLLYQGYSTPFPSSPASSNSRHRLLSAPNPPLQPKGSKCSMRMLKGRCVPQNFLCLTKTCNFSCSSWTVIYKSRILMTSYSISRVTRFQ